MPIKYGPKYGTFTYLHLLDPESFPLILDMPTWHLQKLPPNLIVKQITWDCDETGQYLSCHTPRNWGIIMEPIHGGQPSQMAGELQLTVTGLSSMNFRMVASHLDSLALFNWKLIIQSC